jgi:hypothetical protein
MGEILFYDWTGKMIGVIAFIALVDMFFTIFQLISDRNSAFRNRNAILIDSILAIAALMPLIACISRISQLYHIPQAIVRGAITASPDFRVVITGWVLMFIPLFLGFALFFFYLIVWTILRGVHRRNRKMLA